MSYRDTEYKPSKVREKGGRNLNIHRAQKKWEVAAIANPEVVSTTPTNSIKNVAQLMEEHDYRRIPVVDGGSGRLEGLAVGIDILDFLGGGQKYNIILKEYNGNFLSAINAPIHKIMAQPTYIERTTPINDVVEIVISKKTSAIPVVEDLETKKVWGIVTERDLLVNSPKSDLKVKDIMKEETITSSLGMMLSDVSKLMVRNRLRRLPVISEGNLIGVVTVFDVLRYLDRGEYKGVSAEDNLATRVEEIMEKKVISVAPEDNISKVITLVEDTGLGGFPVSSDGRLKGIITTTDVIRAIYGKGG
ncbi:MAG: CBS domain-containing protein [Candidatus Altiarchaeota archaeon]